MKTSGTKATFTLIELLVVIVFCWQVEAQTNDHANTLASTNATYKIVLTTNRVQAVSWFREVNGQLYNTKASNKFQNIAATVDSVYTNGVKLNWKKTRGIYRSSSYGGLASGNFMSGGVTSTKIGEETVFEKELFLLHPPLASESQSLNVRAMKVGDTNFDGASLELWDCGTPHFVDVVVTNRVAVKP